MKNIIAILSLFLLGCKSKPPHIPADLIPPAEIVEIQRVADIKNDTLWMYSTGSFALLFIGLAIAAFAPSKRFAGIVFMLGGFVGMATVWIFESEWFPWVAGGTVGFIILNALAFAWVKVYQTYFSSSKQEECSKCKADDSPPQS